MIKGQRAFKKIDTKIYIVFLSVIAIALFNAIFSSYTIMKSQKTTQDIVNNTNPSKDALSHLNLLLTNSRMLATNWVYMPSNTNDKAGLKRLNKIEYINAKARLHALMKNWKDKKMVTAVNGIFHDIESLLTYQQQIMNQLSTFDDYQDPMKKFAAEEILERDIIPKTELIDTKLKEIIALQTKEASLLQDQMVAQLNALMAVVFSIAILIIGSLFFAAFVISRSFIVPVMRVREIILEMNLGRLPEYRMGIPRNAVGEMLLALKSLIENVRRTSRFADEIGKGNFDEPFTPLSVDDVHGHALQSMRSSLKRASETEAQRAWANEGLAKLNVIMRSTTGDFNQLLDNIINMLVSYLSVQQAAIFLLNNDDMEEMHIQLGAYYGLNKKVLNSKRYELKEGLVGQAIASNKVIDIENIADPFFTVDMGMLESKTCHLMIIPLTTSGKVVGALSIISLNVLNSERKDFLHKAAEPIAASLFSVRSNLITGQLLEESRKQADELQKQEQELRTINQQLAISDEELRRQQQELQQMNDELHEKARMLEEKNVAIEDASQSLAFKAEQLEQSNKYKSAFLANMSHELRTPLNSILILAKILADNKNSTLNEKQIEHAKVIYKSGSDLLTLINEILDLSKIEAGKVELQAEIFSAKSVAEDMQMLFAEFANDKKLKFAVEVKADANVELFNDKTRVEQIIKNLLSNAFKFTEANGTVTLKFEQALSHSVFQNKSLLAAKQVLAISVQDTGIGIPAEKQALVFEAFQQADGSTSRKYGGTGLGLAICKELAQMMGGEIQLQSREGQGSVFTLFLPLTAIESQINTGATNEETIKQQQTQDNQSSSVMLRDDKATLTTEDKRILIIEDDHVFAQMLVNHCHQNGMKAIVAMQGDEGLKYANDYQPDAIILDMRLPVMDGWTVLQQIKTTEKLKHIPVHVVTSMDKKNMSMEMGADSYFQKPANNGDLSSLMNHITDNIHHKHIRIAAWGNSEKEIQKITQRLKEKEEHVSVECFSKAETCIASLREKPGFKCVIVEGAATNTITTELKDQFHIVTDEQNIPLVYFDGDPGQCLELVRSAIHPCQSPGVEISKTTQHFLNSIKTSAENNHSAGLRMQEILKGKTVLVADDDMRNIYSMTNILENEEMKVICATNGKEALQLLSEHQDIDIVLMDIMMPEMNGYEAMSEIRKIKKYSGLPVIAVTAKAMTGDREKCIEAGASDYITKPVNIELLVSVMQAWLYK